MVFNPFLNKPWFLHVCCTSLMKTLWEKEKLLLMSNFSFSHSVFYPFGELSAIFAKFDIVTCKFVLWERVELKKNLFFIILKKRQKKKMRIIFGKKRCDRRKRREKDRLKKPLRGNKRS